MNISHTKAEKSLSTSKATKVYFWILSYIRPYKFLMILLIMCGILGTVCEMAVPRFFQLIIDTVIPDKDYVTFWKLCSGLIMVLAVLLGINAARNMLQRIIREKTSRDLQYSIFSHLRKLGFSYFEQHPVGDTLSLLNTDVKNVQQIYRDFFPITVHLTIMIIVPLTVIILMDLKLTVIPLTCFLLYFIIGPYILNKTKIYLKWQVRDRTALNKKIYESISAIPEIRAFSAEKWDLKHLENKYNKFKNTRLKSLLYRHFRGCTPRAVTGVGTLVLYIYGAFMIKSGTMNVGELIAFSFYYLMVVRGINHITTIFSEQYYTLYHGERLYDFKKLKPEISEPSNPVKLEKTAGKITLENVWFGYSNDIKILQGFSLDIKPGEKVALVGTSGNGKTTILKLIGRFYDPLKGRIYLDGIDLKKISLSQIHESIGCVFQETYLFGTSIKNNIKFGKPDASDNEVIDAAKSAFAHDFIMETPKGYDTVVGERGIKLSGGQKQRISIARMFIKNPRIILLDEATSSLDNVAELQVKNALDSLMKYRTTIAVAHRLSTIMNYDRIIVIDSGKAAEIGTYSELMKNQGLFYELSLRGVLDNV